MPILQGKTSIWAYEESNVIGSGGNSVVYKAYRSDDAHNAFALKLFTDKTVSEKKLIRFRQEIITMESLRETEGCSELIDSGVEADQPFYVMPYYSGGDLYQRFIKHPQVPRDIYSALNLFIEVVETVSRIHAEPTPLAVRDIKPQNILLSSTGRAIICDFGLALWADTPDEDRLTTQKGVGSSGYRPPEWATKYPDSRQIQGDIWSLGRTLWAILAAQVPPGTYESLGTSEWHLKNFLEDSHVARAVQGLVNQCTQIKPEQRPTAIELLEGSIDVLKYYIERSQVDEGSSLDDQLAMIAMQLPGSEIIATAAQKKAELDSKLSEIDDCQQMVLSKLREFEPKLKKAIPGETGVFIYVARTRWRDDVSWRANAFIQFEPSPALLETGLGRQIRYVFWFGLNSSGDFYWSETAQIDGQDSEGPLINPKSLTTLAAQKCGQIESILAENLIPEIQRMLGFIPPIGAMAKFVNPDYRGSVDFDYSSNDGHFTIGSGDWRFEIVWNKRSDTSIYVVRPLGKNTGIAIAEGAARFWDIKKVSSYDFTSRTRTIQLGQIAILKNQFGYYGAVLVKSIWDNSRGSERDRVEFDFVILDNRSEDFSSTQ